MGLAGLLVGCSMLPPMRPSETWLDAHVPKFGFDPKPSRARALMVIVMPYRGLGPPQDPTYDVTLRDARGNERHFLHRRGDIVYGDVCSGTYEVQIRLTQSFGKSRSYPAQPVAFQRGEIKYFLSWGDLIPVSEREGRYWIDDVMSNELTKNHTSGRLDDIEC